MIIFMSASASVRARALHVREARREYPLAHCVTATMTLTRTQKIFAAIVGVFVIAGAVIAALALTIHGPPTAASIATRDGYNVTCQRSDGHETIAGGFAGNSQEYVAVIADSQLMQARQLMQLAPVLDPDITVTLNGNILRVSGPDRAFPYNATQTCKLSDGTSE